MKTWITGGRVIDPRNHIDSKLNLVLEGGKVVALTDQKPEAGASILHGRKPRGMPRLSGHSHA